MLEKQRLDPEYTGDYTPSLPPVDLAAALKSAAMVLLRQWRIIAAASGAMLALGIAYLLTATPIYTATASIIIDPRINTDGPDAPAAPVLLLSDALVVDSEVEVLRSRNLLGRVIDALAAAGQPGVGGPFDPGGVPLSRDDQMRQLQQRLNVSRRGDTYVIDVSYASPSPAHSAQIANMVVAQYSALQEDQSKETLRGLSDWLQQRVDLLGQQVIEAERREQDFRTQNKLFATVTNQPQSQVDLNAANSLLNTLRATDIPKVQALVDQLDRIISSGAVNAALDLDVRTENLVTLQQGYAKLLGQQNELGVTSVDSPIAARIRDELAATNKRITQEFQAIRDAQAGKLEQLRQQAAELGRRITELEAQAAIDSANMIQVGQLQREADAARTLYETMLGKLNQALQAETYRASSARVIAVAQAPDRQSSPQTGLILVLAAFGGVVLGVGAAFLREQLDGSFRQTSDVVRTLDAPLLGIVPLLAVDRRRAPARRGGTPAPRKFSGDDAQLAKKIASLRFVSDNPNSMFAEAMRSVAFAAKVADPRTTGRVIGITSAVKAEGKTTIAANLAAHVAGYSQRVALVDFDARNPMLTTQLTAGGRKVTRLDELLGADFENLPPPEPVLDGVVVIGNAGDPVHQNLSDSTFALKFDAFIARLKARFDLIVLDLPPVGALVDARAAATVVDHLVIAVHWGSTPRSAVRNHIYGEPQIRERVIGALFTQVPLASFDRYNAERATMYYSYA